jgi:hypothetical protein
VFFQDPAAPSAWHALRWNGLPPEGEIPAFSDRTAVGLLREARERGLSPQSDAGLLPVLLELLAGLIPVTGWPTQMSKSQRTGHARQVIQAQAARADRGGPQPSPSGQPAADGPAGTAEVVTLAWPERVARAEEAIDAERRRRREAAVRSRPAPPPLLRDTLRGKSIFSIPGDEEEPPSPAGSPENARGHQP